MSAPDDESIGEKDAWNRGYMAASHGRSETSNPYDVNSDQHLSWNDGYQAWVDENEGTDE